MRELNENEIEMVSGGGDGEIIGVSILGGASTGLVAAAFVLTVVTPVGWAIGTGIGVTAGVTALGVFVA